MPEPVTIRIPDLPPSANALFTTRKGSSARIKTTEYRRWLEAAIARIRVQADCAHYGQKTPFAVHVQAGVNRARDLDNVIKPTLDALVQAGATPDDRYADDIRFVRAPGVDGLVIDVRHGGAS